jgi:hypothetical protein
MLVHESNLTTYNPKASPPAVKFFTLDTPPDSTEFTRRIIPLIQKAAKYGIGVHYKDIGKEYEQWLIDRLYNTQDIIMVVCTSTLNEGFHLPYVRAIFILTNSYYGTQKRSSGNVYDFEGKLLVTQLCGRGCRNIRTEVFCNANVLADYQSYHDYTVHEPYPDVKYNYHDPCDPLLLEVAAKHMIHDYKESTPYQRKHKIYFSYCCMQLRDSKPALLDDILDVVLTTFACLEASTIFVEDKAFSGFNITNRGILKTYGEIIEQLKKGKWYAELVRPCERAHITNVFLLSLDTLIHGRCNLWNKKLFNHCPYPFYARLSEYMRTTLSCLRPAWCDTPERAYAVQRLAEKLYNCTLGCDFSIGWQDTFRSPFYARLDESKYMNMTLYTYKLNIDQDVNTNIVFSGGNSEALQRKYMEEGCNAFWKIPYAEIFNCEIRYNSLGNQAPPVSPVDYCTYTYLHLDKLINLK